jgi:hypothetical protein
LARLISARARIFPCASDEAGRHFRDGSWRQLFESTCARVDDRRIHHALALNHGHLRVGGTKTPASSTMRPSFRGVRISVARGSISLSLCKVRVFGCRHSRKPKATTSWFVAASHLGRVHTRVVSTTVAHGAEVSLARWSFWTCVHTWPTSRNTSRSNSRRHIGNG